MTIRYDCDWNTVQIINRIKTEGIRMHIQIGRPHVSVQTLEPQANELKNLGKVSNGIFLEPGQGAVLNRLNCPFIIASASWYLIVAYAVAEMDNIIDTITKTFLVRNMPIDDITMCMLFANPLVVPKFVERACQIGLQNFWTMCPLPMHKNLELANRGLNHVLVRRDN